MKTNKFSKRIEQSLAYYASMIFFHLVKLIPVSQIQKVGNIFGSIAYGFIGGSRRKIALCNMAIAFTDRFTEIERAKIFKESVKSFGRMIAETASYAKMFPAYFDSCVEIEGKEHLLKAFSMGKGVIAVGIHMGSFTLISGKLSRIGYTLAYVLRKPENPKLADFLTNLQERLGVHFISDKPRHKSAVECVKALSSGKAIYLMCDVRVNPQNGVEVNFFNRPAYTFTGPVILSMRTGAPIVPLVIVQEGKKKHKILVGDIIPLELTDDKQLDIKRNTENIVRTTEAYIRRYPEQYWWLHNRWNLKKEEMDPQSN